MRYKLVCSRLFLLVIVSLSAGCTRFVPIGPDVTKDTAEVEQQARAVDIRLRDTLTLIAARDLAQQKAKIDALEKLPGLRSSPQHQMQLALLLRLGQPQVRDEKRAAELVRWVVHTGDVPRDRMAAGLIMSLLSELDSRDIQLEKANSNNRELQNSVRLLEDKLKAIKSIEESIIQRGQ